MSVSLFVSGLASAEASAVAIILIGDSGLMRRRLSRRSLYGAGHRQRLLRAISLVLAMLLSACWRLPQRMPAPTEVLIGATPAEVARSATPTESLPSITPTSISQAASRPIDLGDGLIFGAQISPKEISTWCSEVQQLGVRATTLWIPWNQLEPRRGHYRWDELDNIIQSFQLCGLDVGVHVQTKEGWGTLSASPTWSQYRPSMPPADMDDYYNFIFNLVNHLKGRVREYSIENEASALPVWPASPESYFQMLATAYRAVKAANPNAIVLDSGTGSKAYGILLANDMLKSGQGQAAIKFVNEYYAYSSPGRQPLALSDRADLEDLLSDPLAQRVLEWAPLLFSNHAFYDAIQIHYYGPWDKLATVIGWVHDQLRAAGTDKPIEVWELGYGWQDPTTYDEIIHAQDTVKLLVTAAGEGSRRTIYWPFVDKLEKGTPGLVTLNGPRPAGIAYRVTAQMLTGCTSAQRLDLGASGVWAYRFNKGEGDIYVIWSTRPVTVSLPIEAMRVMITDIYGNASTGDPRSLAIGVSPIFVEAESGMP